MNTLAQITAVILAGGAGTRLRSVVADRPKVLAELGGKPFIAYLLDRLVAQGFQKTVLCTGYMGEQVQAALGDEYQGMTLLYSREAQPLGTGGAIVQALPLVTSETVLILNGDSYCETDLPASLAWHQDRGASATVVMAHIEHGARYGRVEISGNGQIKRFVEKNPDLAGGGWINSGVYWFERTVLAGLPQGRAFSLEKEVLGSWSGEGLYGYRDYGRFLDIGVPEDHARAENFLAEVHESVINLAK